MAQLRVVVVGAGAFGGWTALELVRQGVKVTLIDAWGPGHARASSGGETRIIRAGYGRRAIYTRMTVHALKLWRAHEERYGRTFFRHTGGLWLVGTNLGFGRDTFATLRSEDVRVEEFSVADTRRRFPQIDVRGIQYALFEPNAGYLLARLACEHVAECVAIEGGEYRHAAVSAPQRVSNVLKSVQLQDGSRVEADAFVFACGPWLAQLFPDVIGRRILPTRQEVFYFGTPAGDSRFGDRGMPVWIELGKRLMYGIPGNANRGLKIADDTSGPAFDPTAGSRDITRRGLKTARAYLRRRFPALARAPLVGSEVCQYEATRDAHLVVDRHPRASNVWIVGGGSGHGFKMGPAVGEMVAALVLGTAEPDRTFQLARFGGRRALSAKWD